MWIGDGKELESTALIKKHVKTSMWSIRYMTHVGIGTRKVSWGQIKRA
jgi:hypothetical protein